MQTMKRLIDRLAAMLLTAAVAACGLTACAGSEDTAEEPTPAVKPTETTGERIYSVSIAATMGGAETRAVAIDQNAQGKDYLVSTFRTTDNIGVYNKTKDLMAWARNKESGGGYYTYLHADANAKEANLTGGLAFFGDGNTYQEVEEDDVLLLMYNGDDGIGYNYKQRVNPDGTYGQKGTLAGLSDYDFATAEVTITGVSGVGTPNDPYTLTTTDAAFTNLQSMFKLTFTGMPEVFSIDPSGAGINEITIHSANNKLISNYNPATGDVTYGDIVILLGGDGGDTGLAREANGAGNVVYAALRFLPLESGETDEITFTMETTEMDENNENIIYIAKKTSPAGGFQNGKYYTATIAASELIDLSNVTTTDGNGVLYYAAHDGQTLTGSFDGGVGYVTIDDGATVTLSDVNITAPSNCDHAAIHCLGTANIIVSGTGSNHVTAGSSSQYPAIYVPHNTSGTEYKLTISGTGTLIANGSSGHGTGIGGGEGKACGNIEITGGNITANGGGGAGIGCGYGTSCGSITIVGGTVTANGGGNSAGIGCGYSSSCSSISITGGTVTANGGGGAGIGSGYSSSCSSISITGGTVTANGGNIGIIGGAGIGCGIDASCGDISISGGTVTATGGNGAAGIGCGGYGGDFSSCGVIWIGSDYEKSISVTAIKGSNALRPIGHSSDDLSKNSCGDIIFGILEENKVYTASPNNGTDSYLFDVFTSYLNFKALKDPDGDEEISPISDNCTTWKLWREQY